MRWQRRSVIKVDVGVISRSQGRAGAKWTSAGPHTQTHGHDQDANLLARHVLGFWHKCPEFKPINRSRLATFPCAIREYVCFLSVPAHVCARIPVSGQWRPASAPAALCFAHCVNVLGTHSGPIQLTCHSRSVPCADLVPFYRARKTGCFVASQVMLGSGLSAFDTPLRAH